MALGTCPKCRASDYAPDLREQGANRCNRCGHVAMVRDWHSARSDQRAVYREGFKPAAQRIEPRPALTTRRQLEHATPTDQHFWWQDD